MLFRLKTELACSYVLLLLTYEVSEVSTELKHEVFIFGSYSGQALFNV